MKIKYFKYNIINNIILNASNSNRLFLPLVSRGYCFQIRNIDFT